MPGTLSSHHALRRAIGRCLGVQLLPHLVQHPQRDGERGGDQYLRLPLGREARRAKGIDWAARVYYYPYSQRSYAASAGTTEILYYYSKDPAKGWDDSCNQIPPNGAFGANYQYKIADIRDGLSNTIFMGETSRFINEPAGSDFHWWTINAWFGDGMGGGTSRPPMFAYEVPRINAPAQTYGDFSYVENQGPFNWRYDPLAQQYGQFGFRSNHPGGGMFLFGDGSVKFLKQTIAYQTYWGLGTRNGGEVVSADQY